MASPDDRRYSREHEWVRPEGDSGEGTIGITEYAQDQLGDIVFVDLPPVGARVAHLQKMGEIESVKAVSALFSPVSGEVIALNQALSDKPELVNTSPFEGGWMLRVRLGDAAELDRLLTAQQYDDYVAESHPEE